MIRLTVTLIVAIYVVLIVVPGVDHGDNVEVTRADGQNWLIGLISSAEAEAQRPPRDAPANSARTLRSELTDDLLETDDGYALQTVEGEVLAITAVIDPVDLLPDDGAATVAAVSVVDPSAVEVVQEQAREERIIWRVAGSNVNFRAGPSTNTAILAGLVRGDEVEFLADAPDGWAHLRVLDSGLEGYMAARFLEPVN